MNVRMLCLLITGSLVGGAAGQQEKSDLEKIKGSWVIPVPKVFDLVFIFGDAKGTARAIPKAKTKEKDEPKDKTFTFKLDPTKNPKEIDILFDGMSVEGITGIYWLEGDILKISFVYTPPPKEGQARAIQKRPTNFESKGDQKVLFLERQKP